MGEDTPDTISRPRLWRRMIAGEPRRVRLGNAIADLERAYAHRRQQVAQTEKTLVSEAEATLGEAKRALDLENLDAGWSFVHRAERIVAATDALDERQARAVRLREEAREKLSGWRRATALCAVGEPAKATLADVRAAMDMLSERASNQYHKADLLAGQLMVIGGILLLALASVLIGALVGMSPLAQYAVGLVWAMLLGALGGTLSAARGLTTSTQRKIPEQIYSWPITLIRPVLGAAAGTGAFLLLMAGIVSVTASNNEIAPVVVAFVAGFSERYFLSLVPSGEKSG